MKLDFALTPHKTATSQHLLDAAIPLTPLRLNFAGPKPPLRTSRRRGNPTPDPEFFDNQLINYEQAARHLSLSVPYLHKLKKRGKIPFVPMGRGVRFRVKSLNEWVEKREIK